jgi:hypothetical protein
MVGSGIVATLVANIAYGLGGGAVGAMYSGWPGYSFAVAAAAVAALVRRVAGISETEQPALPAALPERDTLPAPLLARVPETDTFTQPDTPRPDTPSPVRVSRPPVDTPEADIPVLAARLNGHAAKAVQLFAADLAAGQVPGISRIRADMGVGQPKAQAIRAYLRALPPPDISGKREAS